jgi:hypothetical protein
MTPAFQLPKERVSLLAPADIEAYLLSRDWQEDRPASSAQVGTFRYRPSPEIAVMVPRDRAFGDYALRVGDVLATLAVVERRKGWDVLEDLLSHRQAASRNGAQGNDSDAPKRSRSRRPH